MRCLTYTKSIRKLYLLQSLNTFFQRFDNTFRICLFLTFQFKNSRRSIINEFLVAKFFQHSLQEPFFVFELRFHTGDLRFHINHIPQWNGEFSCSNHEGSCTFRLALHYCKRRKITHLNDNRIHLLYRMTAYNL